MKYLNWQLWLLVFGLAGCARTNDAGTVDVGFELALASGESASAAGALVADEIEGGKLEITQARAVVERIELYLPTPVAAASTDCDPEPGDDNPHCGDSGRRHGSGRDSGRDDSGDDDSRQAGDDDSRHGGDDDSRHDSSDDSVSGNGDKITIRGPYVVDLVDGSSLPSIAQVEVPAGRYRRVDVRFSNDAGGKLDASDPLHGHTFVAEGTFTPNGGEAMPFSVALDFNAEARFESAEGFDIDADAVSDLVLTLDISSWFAGRPLAECVDGGVLAIDEKSACDFGHDLKEAIKDSGRLEHR